MLRFPYAVTLLVSAAVGTYVIEDDSFGHGSDEVRMKVLVNRATEERVEIAYTAGGRTEEVVLRSPATGSLRKVLLSSERNATDVKVNNGWKGDMLIPYANRIKNASYTLNGKTYYMERNEDRSPYGKEGLHGYLYKKVMRVVNHKADNESASLTLAYDFDGTDPGYPFLLSVQLTYTLDKKGLTITTQAKNRGTGGQPLPFFNSWHSYFLVNDISKAVVTLDRCSGWNHISVTGDDNIKSDLIPTGKTTVFHGFNGKSPVGGTTEKPTYYDDEFKATASEKKCPYLHTRVHDPSTGETSVLWGDSSFRWWQVYTGTKKAMNKQAIAVEAMSGECDAWNNLQGARVLQSGEEWEGSFGVYMDHASPILPGSFSSLVV